MNESSRRSWWLAIAIVSIELIAGMQIYVSSTIVPLLAKELGGQHLYGVANGTVQAAVFLSLPLSPWLIRRWSSSVVLTVSTAVGVIAALVASVSPSMWFYIVARIVSGLASGALAGVGMGIIAKELSGRARRFTLAANNLMWVAASIVGPTYAAWVASAFSWRIALVAYLPFLIFARLVIVVQLRKGGVDSSETGTDDSVMPWKWAIVLSVGMIAIGARPPRDVTGIVLLCCGLVAVVLSLRILLPSSVASLRSRGTGAAIQLLAWSTAVVYGAEAVVAIIAHDAMNFDSRRIGALLMTGGLAWSLVGLLTAARPAGKKRFVYQASLSVLLMTSGIAMCVASIPRSSVAFAIGWILVNVGIGLVYLDLMNLVFGEELNAPLEPAEAGATVVFVESAAGAVFGTICTSIVSIGISSSRLAVMVVLVPCVMAAQALWRIRGNDG